MAVIFLAQAVSATVYYVSKSGGDSNAGTSTNAAYLTIQKAASVMNAGDTCYIFSGTYRETVTPAHSGTSGSPITFTAYPGESPIVSGADVISLTWSVYSNSIYRASTGASFRQLFVEGVMMNEARWPNATVNNLLYAPRSVPTSVTLTNLIDNALSTNFSLVGAYMHFFPSESGSQGYAANTRVITNWNSVTKQISWSGNVQQVQQTGCLYYLYGVLSLLDIPTEWCLDTTGGKLYLWTPDGASPTNHVVEVKNRTSAFTLDNRSYVIVSGMNVFAAGISMSNTTSCVVDNCNLVYVQHNTTADWTVVNLPIANQVSGTGSIWKNSTIRFSSQDGIRCTGQNEVVSNCVIQHVAYYPGTYYACVTAYSPASGTKILNNTLWYSGRYCVGEAASSIEIGYNDLGWGVLLTSDGGGTYDYTSSGTGTIIHHNWVHNCWAGIYIDGGQSNYRAYNNVCYSNQIGMLLNITTTNNSFVNNTMLDNTAQDLYCGANGQVTNRLINNIWHSLSGGFSSTDIVTNNGSYPPVSANYVLLPGSTGIHGGIYYTNLPILENGYNGGPPDVGAYQNGQTWTPGANFVPPPFPYGPPSITTPPASQTDVIGQAATFTLTAGGTQPLYYQWRAGTTGGGVYTNLTAGGQFSAVTNATVTITNLTLGNAGDYEVVVTNVYGSITSAVATLTIVNPSPSITMQPASQTYVVGQTAMFNVTAVGLAPLSYQWRAGATGSEAYTNLVAGGQFSAVTNTIMIITNLMLGNTADYEVVVTNSVGSITSAVATLSVVRVPPYQVMILGDSPVAYWPMQETTGPTIHDIIGGYDGTLMTSTDGTSLGNNQHTNFATAGAVPSDGATYLLGGSGIVPGDTAIYFTNLDSSVNNSQIVVPYDSALDPSSALTAESWIKVPTYPIGYTKTAFQTSLGLEANGGAGNGWWMGVKTDSSGSQGDVQFNVAQYPGGWIPSPPTSAASFSGNWVHVVEVYTGSNSNLLCYTNGVLMKTVAMTNNYESEGIYGTHKLPFIIGSYCASYNGGGTLASGFERGDFWHGGISHVAIYNHALSASQILNHYQVGSTPPAPPIMSIRLSGSNVMVNWTSGFLQKAISVTGPWTDVTNAISPYSIGATNSALFFRAKL